MLLGSRGRRSIGARITTGVALTATLLGQLRMTYALAGPAAPAGGAAAGQRMPPVAAQGAATPAKLSTDVPWALATAVRPARIKVLAGAADEAEVWQLFDGRAATGVATDGRPSRFLLELPQPTYIDAVAVFGTTAGALSLEAEGTGAPVTLLQKASLAGGGERWNRRELTGAPLATAVVVTFDPSGQDARLPELELWGRPASAPPPPPATDMLPDALYTRLPERALELRAPQDEQTISSATVVPGGTNGVFTFNVDVDPTAIDRAFLVYELVGLPHFTAAARALNGERALGRFGVSHGAKGGLQVEEISPASLRPGRNKVQFFAADDRSPEGYRVSEVRVVVVPHGETRLADASARDVQALRDGTEATGWRAPAAKPAEVRRWEFASVTQPWGLDFRLPSKGVGTLTVASASGGNKGQITVKLDGLSAGWHRVPLDKMPAGGGLTLTLAAGKEVEAAISEMTIEGSPLPVDEAPRVAITYPLSGECVNHRVHVRGFVTPAGAEAIYAAGHRFDGALGRDGAFAFELAENEAAGREVIVEAAYPGGARVRRAVNVGRCIERPPTVIADDGRPREPKEDLGAPYGVTVRAGQAASLSFAGVKLDIPAGAVEKDVRLTVRPLPTKQVAPMDAGMTNISPEGQAFRFGPHGMAFKKPIRMTLPYAKSLIPAGYTESDVRTFYYNEVLHRWDQVGLLAQNAGEMVSVTEHFTDFVNATLAMPDHPGTQSMNPTSLKDIKLGDPAAAIGRIAPPAPSSSGAAHVSFPIEVPPGRRGLQPNLALTYSNNGGNSWVGMGWDIQPPSIEIDTRFGVPRYQGEEVYLLNGDMLTPSPGGGGMYRRRAEGSFDLIQRLGTSPSNGGFTGQNPNCYSWKVTDKNGTVYLYGPTQESRLFAIDDGQLPAADTGHVSRWYLASVTDVFGNQMKYTYVQDRIQTGVGQGAFQLYLSTIEYTSNTTTGLAAPYSVNFDSGQTDPDRPDTFLSAKTGFLVETRRLLKSITVALNGTVFRRYNLTYKDGAFGKKLLASIASTSTDGSTEFYKHTFDYRKIPIIDGGDTGAIKYYDPPVVWGRLRFLEGTGVFAQINGGITSSDSNMSGLNANVGISLGAFSAHIGGGATSGDETGHLLPVDLNGDGLPDFVNDVGGVNFNSLNAAIPEARFTTVSSDLPGYLTHTNRNGWNFEGDLGLNFSSSAGLAGIGFAPGYSRTSIEDDRVITDFDGDGFNDIVQIKDGQITVYKNQNGQFDAGTNVSNGVLATRAVTVSEWDAAKPQGIFPVDTVTRWVAPFNGHVKITGPILKKDPSTGDGVHASIYISSLLTPGFFCKLWESDITNQPCAPSTPGICPNITSNGMGCDGSSPPQATVLAGDRIYMVVDPKTNSDADAVIWNPTITYDEFAANPNKRDPDGATTFQFSQRDDFRLAGLPYMAWTANGDGDVLFNLSYDKLSTPDNVRLQVFKNPPRDTATLSGNEIWGRDIAANQPEAAPNFTVGPFSVVKGDRLVLQVTSDAPIDPARMGFGTSFVQYLNFCRERGQDQNGVPRQPVCGRVNYTTDTQNHFTGAQIENDTIRLSLDTVRRPFTPHFPPRRLLPGAISQSFTAPGSTFTISGTLQNSAFPPVPVTVLVQGVNKLLAKVPVGPSQRIDLPQIQGAVQGEPIFLTVLSTVPNAPPNVQWSPTVSGSSVPFRAVYRDTDSISNTSAHGPDPFSGGYHNWYFGDFDGSKAFSEGLLKTPKFPFNRQRDDFMFCFPINGEDGRAPHFKCRGADSYVTAGEMQPSFAASGMGNQAQLNALRLGETANTNVSASVRVLVAGTGLGIGVGQTKSTLDFMDMNGDGIPDSAAGGGILYSDGKGGFPFSSNPGIGNLRNTSSRNIRGSIDVGSGDVGQLLNVQESDGSAKTVVSTKVGVGVDYGFTSTNTEMVDINGDGLPDQVSRDPRTGTVMKVRFNLGYRFWPPPSQPALDWTNPQWPGLQFDTFNSLSDLTTYLGADTGTEAISVQDTGSNSAAINLGGTIPVGNAQVTAGGGIGDVQTTMRTMSRMLDVNGDGLPDHVIKVADDLRLWVKLNMGTYFTAAQPWNLGPWHDPNSLNASQNLPIKPPPSFYYPTSFFFLQNPDTVAASVEEGWQGSLGFEFCIFWCVGVSGFTSGQGGWSQMDFEDIDGDGHPDHVLKLKGDDRVYAKLSTIGNANMLEKITGPLGETTELTYSRAGNYVDTEKSVDMPTNHWVLSQVKTGDGRGNFYTDHISYGVYNPTVTGIGVIPSGFYDRKEREDYGFGHVEITRGQFVSGNWVEGDGSQVERFFYNQDFYRKGQLQAEFEMDAAGSLLRGRRIDIPQPGDPVDDAGLDTSRRTGFFFPKTEDTYALFYEKQKTFMVIPSELTASTFAAPKTKHEFRKFDDRGNLTNSVDFGDPQLPSREVDYTIAWTDFDATTNITRPTSITATAGPTGPMLRKRDASYVPGKGVPGVVRNYITGGNAPGSGMPGQTYNQATAAYVFSYDDYGNVLTYSDPTAYGVKYTYDTTAQTYVTKVEDLAFGYSSTASYNLSFGAIESAIDINGKETRYQYDAFGRLCTVRGPDDLTASEPTIGMTYSILSSSCPNSPILPPTLPAYAVTRHKDVQVEHAGDPITTVAFIDGLGRVIQTKKDLDRDNGDGTFTTGMSVSGQIVFDTRGRVSSQAQPSFSTGTATALVAANVSNPTTFGYDEIGRQTSMNVPDGTSQGIQTTTTYSIVTPNTPNDNLGDGLTWFLTEVKDGIANNVPAPPANTGRRLTYADARGNRIAVREYDQIGTSTSLTTLTTKYAYDPLDQLLTVTDAKGNPTSSSYDTLGRMVTLVSKDTGLTEYRYDLNGNLKEKQTPNLRAQSRFITYAYDFNRLKTVTYPNLTQVTYTYGDPTGAGDVAGNTAGRISKVTYEAGNETRTYDHLGNVNKTVTTLNRMSTTTGLPATIAFTMHYSYDWLGRMQDMTFPNWIDQSFNIVPGTGELVTYKYDHGGNLDSITGDIKTPNPQQTTRLNFPYVSHIRYNEFEQRTSLTSGNGIVNKYLYEPTTRRVSDINADSHPAGQPTTPFHRLHYTYDKVGNVLHQTNNLSVRPYLSAGVFVGPLDVTYTYDNVYQLQSMSQKYRGHVAYGYQSNDTYTFDEIGNIKSKAQRQDRLVWDNQTVNQGDTNPVATQLAGSRFDHIVSGLTYNLSYTYPAARPHGATPVSETPSGSTAVDRVYAYDANGNNTGNAFNLNTRTQVWDEENRLKQVTQNGGSLAQFKYDDTGERKKKMTSAGDSWYVNQFFALLPGNRPTKHIFAGETRVATKTDSIFMQTAVLHYYHPDHIGTTSYLTDANQVLVQHERYFAYGELWRPGGEQEETDLSRPNGDRREWLFTSKEWDVDTNLYYFGARYFDPHADAWQSTDPMVASYLRAEPGGGGYQPRDLSLYSYAWNNPVALRDPNGRDVHIAGPAGHVETLLDAANSKLAVYKLTVGGGTDRHLHIGRRYDVPDSVRPSASEQAFFNLIDPVIRDQQNHINFTVVNDDPNVFFGSYNTGQLDAADFSAVQHLNTSGFPPSVLGLFAHEVFEQYQKVVGHLGNTRGEYNGAHAGALQIEVPIQDGFQRAGEDTRGRRQFGERVARDQYSRPGGPNYDVLFRFSGPNDTIRAIDLVPPPRR
jgi:RHS repeat-associated protein